MEQRTVPKNTEKTKKSTELKTNLGLVPRVRNYLISLFFVELNIISVSKCHLLRKILIQNCQVRNCQILMST